MALAFLTLAIEPVWRLAPLAVLGIGLGFYMLHNTLQTEATQMTPEARGTSVALFASVYFSGRRSAWRSRRRCSTATARVPLFLFTAAALAALGWWFAWKLDDKRQR